MIWFHPQDVSVSDVGRSQQAARSAFMLIAVCWMQDGVKAVNTGKHREWNMEGGLLLTDS